MADEALLCTICARGGSKGVPGKNLRLLAGKPLIAHSIAQARETGLFRYLVVNSDSEAILAAASNAGADILIERPADLATDTAAKPPVIRSCFDEAERRTGLTFDILVDLDATSPLRTSDDIRNAVDLLRTSGAGNVITGTPARRSPYFNLVELSSNGTAMLSKPGAGIVRRQDAPSCYDMNASVYVWTRAAMLEGPQVFRSDTRLYVMPPERSVDIDSETDWAIVEFLMTGKAGSKP